MSTFMYENIKDGKYENKIPYPSRSDYSNKDAALTAMKTYRAGNAAAEELFKKDLFDEYGVQGHPKADRAYQIAWSRGHSSGYYEVVNYFQELAELLT